MASRTELVGNTLGVDGDETEIAPRCDRIFQRAMVFKHAALLWSPKRGVA